MVQKGLVLGILLLMVVSLLPVMTVGYHTTLTYKETYKDASKNSIVPNEDSQDISECPPMDSPWPMKCHDLHHTSRSLYSTASNPGIEKWRFRTNDSIEGSPVIGDDGTIYVGSFDWYLYAINPNGTLKWKYKTDMYIWSAPALAEDGTLYVGSMDDRMYAFYSNGTKKWHFNAGGSIISSPAIADDGIIYFGVMGPGFDLGRIYALYPNGTEQWHYDTDYWIVSNPAIGNDGTIYIGSGDGKLYAMNPNGTVQWTFPTGGWIKSHPSIADDGTIYFDSFDGYLYALFSNGTMKWRTTGGSGCSSVAIGEDGMLYFSGGQGFRSIYPENGTTKWSVEVGTSHSSPAISADGTIYLGGDGLTAINPDGTIKWKNYFVKCESSPAIAKDGTIYIGSSNQEKVGQGYILLGYLHAVGPGDLKRIEIAQPELGNLYLFNRKLFSTPFGATRILGDFTIKLNSYSEDEIERVEFFLDYEVQYIDTTSPFTWTLDEKLDPWGFGWHSLRVTAYYQGGCSWTEELDFWFFHL